MNSAAVRALDQAISAHSFRPKGIKVGTELWKVLDQAGRIQWKRGYFQGIVDSGFDLPGLDENIFVHVAPELDELKYVLPQSS